METRANYVLVGAFTLLTLLAAFAFVFWTARYGESTDRVPIVITIPGSAAGLSRGSEILFNGIRIGAVRNVALDPQNPQLAIVEGDIDPRTPIKASTKASLNIQGLTGQAYIELTGGSGSEPNLIGNVENDGPLIIQAEPSFFTDIIASSRKLLVRAETILGTFDDTVQQLQEPVLKSAQNTQVFTQALADRSGEIDAFLASIGSLAKTAETLSTQIDPILSQTQNILAAIDPEMISNTLSNVELLTERVAAASAGLEDIVTTIDETTEEALSLMQNANGTVRQVKALTEEIAPEDMRAIIDNVASLTDNANKAAMDAQKLTSSLADKSGDIDGIVANASQMVERLNAASVRVDGILVKVDALLGSGEAGALGGELNATLSSYRKLADSLNARIPEIADGLARFTGSGLRDVQRSVSSAEQSVERIERAITDLARNPQRIITGGDGEVRTFDGRQRR